MESNPLELMYSWQALLCAAACAGVTQLVKTVLDLSMATKAPQPASGPKAAGKEVRKASRWWDKVILPVTPILIGFVYAATIPLRPETLIDFVDARVDAGFFQVLAYGAWGAACGQFSTMLFAKLKDFIKHGS